MTSPNRSDVSPIERIAGFHWDHYNRSPVKVAKREAPAALRKVRGVVVKGTYSERAGLLGTFVADPRPIDSVRYFDSSQNPGMVYVSVTRSMWTTWRGEVTAAQFDTLRAHIGAAKCAPAFPSTPVRPLPGGEVC